MGPSEPPRKKSVVAPDPLILREGAPIPLSRPAATTSLQMPERGGYPDVRHDGAVDQGPQLDAGQLFLRSFRWTEATPTSRRPFASLISSPRSAQRLLARSVMPM